TFVFTQGGALSGTVEGGAGGYDTVVLTGAYSTVAYKVTGPQSGEMILDGQLLRYAGMEPIQFTQSAGVFTYTGTAGDDTIQLHGIAGGMMAISGTGETVQFTTPPQALKIVGADGNDTINVDGSLTLPGAALSLDAETVEVKAGVTVSTRNANASGTSLG